MLVDVRLTQLMWYADMRSAVVPVRGCFRRTHMYMCSIYAVCEIGVHERTNSLLCHLLWQTPCAVNMHRQPLSWWRGSLSVALGGCQICRVSGIRESSIRGG
jgi:hypothetical protein